MVKIANDEWIVDLGGRTCWNVGMNFIIEIEYKNYSLTGKIIKKPRALKRLKATEKEKELYCQLNIMKAIDLYMEALRESYNMDYNLTVQKK